MPPLRTIKAVAHQTGLSVHAIRVWEKRYGAVKPARSENKRRLYSEEDVERLRLLRKATLAGHSIGQIARASLPQLRKLLAEKQSGRAPGALEPDEQQRRIETLTAGAIEAIRAFEADEYDALLDRAAAEFGSPAVLHLFIGPLTERVGELWRAGDFMIAHEHFASHGLSDFLSRFGRPVADSEFAPRLLVTTPPGHLHELGALLVAAAARTHGWRATHLGASLPIEELAGAASRLGARAVGLSIVYPAEDEALFHDLRRLRELLPSDCAILVGGRLAGEYGTVIREIKAIRLENLPDLYPVLDKLARAGTGKR